MLASTMASSSCLTGSCRDMGNLCGGVQLATQHYWYVMCTLLSTHQYHQRHLWILENCV